MEKLEGKELKIIKHSVIYENYVKKIKIHCNESLNATQNLFLRGDIMRHETTVFGVNVLSDIQ